MCGICGIIGLESQEASEPLVRRMMAAMAHRGPDDEGALIAPRAAVGMRRLSILDLPGGGQPLWNESGTLAVVFNGEIYNFRELRAELQAAGHRFRTRSDTEVIVHGYEQWGREVAAKLRGMFAFAVLEMPRGRNGQPAGVFIARDPLGIKPLYYAIVGGALLFASELRALVASGAIEARLNGAQLPAYLLFGSIGEPDTLLEGVQTLPPGCSLAIPADLPIEAPAPMPYWDFARDPATEIAERAPAERVAPPSDRVRSLLEHAVASHLVADVPVGVFLSGGIDSTVLAALASRARPGVHTFTVAFPDARYSEAAVARRTARRLGTEHRELTLSDGQMVARLDEAIAAFDQPSMDGVNTYFVSWAAREAGLKVALSGLGSDELFGGYATFQNTGRIARIAALARLIPAPVRNAIAFGLGASSPSKPATGKFAKIAAAFANPDSLPHPYFFTRLLFAPEALSANQAQIWRSQRSWSWLADASRQAAQLDDFAAVSWLELRSYLLNTLLRDTDAMSMRHSLEVRVPFLDISVVEYVLSLPASAKLDGSGPKPLLVQAMGDLLPGEILGRRKRTFTFPWEHWLRGELGRRVAAGFGEWSPALEPHVSREFAAAVWEGFLRGRTTWSRPWSLYVLNEWAKRTLHSVSAGRARASSVAAAACDAT
ncbi:MAG: asparagine synthase (glutamine-hydrolyzing) [Acidobacteriota bacterium]|nr:asparagine synthase (glutamine-hydrolyzing) [Acidobacteriota bacterium]